MTATRIRSVSIAYPTFWRPGGYGWLTVSARWAKDKRPAAMAVDVLHIAVLGLRIAVYVTRRAHAGGAVACKKFNLLPRA